MTESRPSPLNRVLGAIVPRAVDALDPDELLERIDLDATLERIDLNLVLDRLDLNALLARIDIDVLMDRINIEALIGRVDLDALLTTVDVEALITRIDLNALMTQIDVGALVGRIDIDGLMAQVDIDALLARVDIGGLIARIDVNEIVDQVDVDALVRKVDVPEIIDRVDMDALIGRVDVNAIVADVDVDALISKVDVDQMVQRIDVPALVKRVDVEAIIDEVDIQALMGRAGIDKIVAEATSGVATRTLDLARRQILGFDLILLGFFDRVLRRPRGTIDGGMLPAGPLARLLGFMVDSVTVSASFGLGISLVRYLVGLFTSWSFDPDDANGIWWLAAFLGWWFLYLWVSLAISGRTIGKALLGLQVLDTDGNQLDPGRCALRVFAFPFSLILGIGMIPAILGRDRRALHDYVAASREIVDWGPREVTPPERLRTLIASQPQETPE